MRIHLLRRTARLRQMTRPRRMLLLLAVAPLALAACGSGSDLLDANATAIKTGAIAAAPTPDYLVQAANQTVALQTGRIEGQFSGQGVDATLTGSFDTAKREAQLTLSMSGSGEAGDLDVVVADDQLYVRPQGLEDLGALFGTPWLSVDLSQLSSMVPGDVELPAVDPAELIDKLATEGITVTEIGQESVRGVAATHYRATVPAGTGAVATPGATLDVWIDGDGLVRRIDVQADDGSTGRIELFDLGKPVTIEVPPADQVTDLGDLEGLLGKMPR